MVDISGPVDLPVTIAKMKEDGPVDLPVTIAKQHGPSAHQLGRTSETTVFSGVQAHELEPVRVRFPI